MSALSSQSLDWCVAHDETSFNVADAVSVQITAWVDEGLDHRSYIVPGLGDFGDR